MFLKLYFKVKLNNVGLLPKLQYKTFSSVKQQRGNKLCGVPRIACTQLAPEVVTIDNSSNLTCSWFYFCFCIKGQKYQCWHYSRSITSVVPPLLFERFDSIQQPQQEVLRGISKGEDYVFFEAIIRMNKFVENSGSQKKINLKKLVLSETLQRWKLRE